MPASLSNEVKDVLNAVYSILDILLDQEPKNRRSAIQFSESVRALRDKCYSHQLPN